MPHKVRYSITEQSDGYIIFLLRNISFHGSAVTIVVRHLFILFFTIAFFFALWYNI